MLLSPARWCLLAHSRGPRWSESRRQPAWSRASARSHCPLPSAGPPASRPRRLYSDAPSLSLSECQHPNADPQSCPSGPPRPEATAAGRHHSVSSAPLRRQEPYLRRSDSRHPRAKPPPQGHSHCSAATSHPRLPSTAVTLNLFSSFQSPVLPFQEMMISAPPSQKRFPGLI